MLFLKASDVKFRAGQRASTLRSVDRLNSRCSVRLMNEARQLRGETPMTLAARNAPSRQTPATNPARIKTVLL